MALSRWNVSGRHIVVGDGVDVRGPSAVLNTTMSLPPLPVIVSLPSRAVKALLRLLPTMMFSGLPVVVMFPAPLSVMFSMNWAAKDSASILGSITRSSPSSLPGMQKNPQPSYHLRRNSPPAAAHAVVALAAGAGRWNPVDTNVTRMDSAHNVCALEDEIGIANLVHILAASSYAAG
jgi:hypothetical protein